MDSQTEPLIFDVQRMDGGVLVSFSDHRNVFYSAALLYKVIDQAEEHHIPEEED
jgi:hypothetical protein